MERNDRQAAVPKTGACSSSTATTQPATAFFALNFAIESNYVMSGLDNKSSLFIC